MARARHLQRILPRRHRRRTRRDTPDRLDRAGRAPAVPPGADRHERSGAIDSREVIRTQWLRLRRGRRAVRRRFALARSRSSRSTTSPLVIPYTGEGFWLVQQYRYPVGGRAWEFPQGGWPPGTAVRSSWPRPSSPKRPDCAPVLEHLGRLYRARPGHQSFDVFLATGLTKAHRSARRRSRTWCTPTSASPSWTKCCHAGEFRDSNSVAALALFWLCSRARP